VLAARLRLRYENASKILKFSLVCSDQKNGIFDHFDHWKKLDSDITLALD
jgi:hypothetical protein